MKLKANLVINELLDGYVAVGVAQNDDDFNGIIHLNESAKRILELLQEGKDIDGAVASLLSEYDITEDFARAEVESLVSKLRDNGLV